MRATLLLTAATPAFGQQSNSNTTVYSGAASVPVVIGASTQVTNRVVEPVTQSFDSLISAPVEYNENGVAKAQYFKASDLTPEQNKAFQEEVNRVRTYQSRNGNDVFTPNYTYSEGTSSGAVLNSNDSITFGANAPADANQAVTYGSATQPDTSGAYEIDLYEPQTYGSSGVSNVTVVNEPVGVQSYAAATHTVGKGDTLYSLSKRYNVTVGQLQDENGLAGTTLSLGQSLKIPSSKNAVTLNTIAQPIFVSAPVREGAVTRRIVQPVATTSRPANTYAVLKKDTLYSIAKRSCVSVNDLAAQNGITDPSSLQLGQKLTLPLGHCQAN